MAQRINEITLTPSRYANLRIRRTDRERLLRHVFQRYPNREWGTFIKLGFRRTAWGLSFAFADTFLPMPGDLDRRSAATVFRDQYTLRALRNAAGRELAFGVVHSHPAGFRTSPSMLDDDMDLYFAREFTAYSGGFPYCSLIFQRDDRRGLTFSGRVYDRGEWLPIVHLFTVGDTLEQATSELCASAPMANYDSREVRLSTRERLQHLIGLPSAERLRRAKVGCIGCSGTGTPALHVLIRAGIENFVLVDPQRLSPSNLERLHGSYDSDLDTEPYPFKVELAQRMIWAINPNAKVTALVGNVLQENVIDELLTCDLVLCCTDSIHSRVFLSDYAKHFLLPSIDVGIDMDGQSGQITSQLVQLTKYTPDLPCAFCNGLIDTAQMSVELMTEDEKRARQAAAKEAEKRGDNPDQYWRNQRQLHTVGYLTTTAGALTAGYAEGWLTGAFEMPHSAFQFDIGQERLGVVPCLPVRTSCNCGEHIGWADQAKAFRNVSRPPHIPSKALLLSRNVQLC